MTNQEKLFADRMAHHMADGLSFEDAARAVVKDDQRIYKTWSMLDSDGRREMANAIASPVYDELNGPAND